MTGFGAKRKPPFAIGSFRFCPLCGPWRNPDQTSQSGGEPTFRCGTRTGAFRLGGAQPAPANVIPIRT
jgi:hypothetical protein